VAAVDADGATRIVRVALDAAEISFDELEFLTDDTTVVNGFDIDDDTLVFTGSTPQSPAVLGRIALRGRAESGTASVMGDTVIVKEHPAPANSVLPQVLRVPGVSGTITGWLAKPHGDGPFPRHPQHPRRTFRPVHAFMVRRDPGAHVGRLCRRVLEPARLRRTHPQLGDRRPGRYGAARDGRCARRPRPRPRVRSLAGPQPSGHPRRIVWGISHSHDDRRGPSLPRSHRRTRLPRPRQLRRNLRHRPVLHRGVHEPQP
jgi:hypothetical protein